MPFWASGFLFNLPPPPFFDCTLSLIERCDKKLRHCCHCQLLIRSSADPLCSMTLPLSLCDVRRSRFQVHKPSVSHVFHSPSDTPVLGRAVAWPLVAANMPLKLLREYSIREIAMVTISRITANVWSALWSHSP